MATVAVGSIAETTAGSKTELVGGAKLEIITKSKAENIGVGKVLTAGAVEITAGTDATVGAEGALALNIGGTLESKCGADFSITGSSVSFNIASSLLMDAGGSIKASPGSIEIKGSSVGGKAANLTLKGTVHYK